MRAPETLGTMFRYQTHIDNNSLYNTPPTFGIYILMLVTRWVKGQGIEALYKRNVEHVGDLFAEDDLAMLFYLFIYLFDVGGVLLR